jgi:large subunit ribosomal protein L21
MFAVVKTGGKQYRVAADDIIAVEKLDAEPGATVELTDVLMVGDDKAQTAGTPVVEGATVAAEVVKQARAKKIIVFKKKRRKDYQRTKGHKQPVTVLRITEILTDGKKPSKRAAAKADSDSKPAAKPKTEDKPKAAAKPKAETEAKADDKPKAKTASAKKPAAKKPATKKPAAKKPAAKKEE